MIRAVLAAMALAYLTPSHAAEGIASWYGSESGRATASGERFHPDAMTCAMRTHNWHVVRVTVLATGKSASCRINDYGPAARTGRLIDVSHGMAVELGFVGQGLARVRVE
jgi:rare lipoprotein A